LREILANDGSICVHLDWRIVYIDTPSATKQEFRGSHNQREGGGNCFLFRKLVKIFYIKLIKIKVSRPESEKEVKLEMKAALVIIESRSNPFFFPKIKGRMIMIKKNYLLIIAAWLVAAGFIIIPRFIFKQSVLVNTDLSDVIRAINGLNLTIFAAEGIATGILITVIALLYKGP